MSYLRARNQEAVETTVLSIFLAAFALRAIQVGPLPPADERITMMLIERYSLLELPVVIPRVQPHFPLYYIILELWSYVLPVESARWLSILAGSCVPVVTYLFGRDLLSEWQALIATGLTIISPVLAGQSHWLRMYALLALVVLVGWWHAYKVIYKEASLGPYFALGLATIGLHPFGVAVVIGQVVWLSYEQHRTYWRAYFRGTVLTVMAIGGVLVTILLARIFTLIRGGIPNGMHTAYAPIPVAKAVLLPVTTLTGTIHNHGDLVGALLLLVILLYGIANTRISHEALFACAILIPLGVLYLGHLLFPILMLKYVAWLGPFVALAVGSVLTKRKDLLALLPPVEVAVIHLILGVTIDMHVSQVTIWIVEYADSMGVV